MENLSAVSVYVGELVSDPFFAYWDRHHENYLIIFAGDERRLRRPLLFAAAVVVHGQRAQALAQGFLKGPGSIVLA